MTVPTRFENPHATERCQAKHQPVNPIYKYWNRFFNESGIKLSYTYALIVKRSIKTLFSKVSLVNIVKLALVIGITIISVFLTTNDISSTSRNILFLKIYKKNVISL